MSIDSHENLFGYVEQELQAGKSKQIVYDQLLAAGHPSENIINVFSVIPDPIMFKKYKWLHQLTLFLFVLAAIVINVMWIKSIFEYNFSIGIIVVLVVLIVFLDMALVLITYNLTRYKNYIALMVFSLILALFYPFILIIFGPVAFFLHKKLHPRFVPNPKAL